MGRGSKIKRIEKNGYSKFQQVLVKTGDKKKPKKEKLETPKEPEKLETPKLAETLEKSKNLQKSVTPETSAVAEKLKIRDKSDIPVPDQSHNPDNSGTSERCESSERFAAPEIPTFEKPSEIDEYVKIGIQEKSSNAFNESKSPMISKTPLNGFVKSDAPEITARLGSSRSTPITSEISKGSEIPKGSGTSKRSETPKFETLEISKGSGRTDSSKRSGPSKFETSETSKGSGRPCTSKRYEPPKIETPEVSRRSDMPKRSETPKFEAPEVPEIFGRPDTSKNSEPPKIETPEIFQASEQPDTSKRFETSTIETPQISKGSQRPDTSTTSEILKKETPMRLETSLKLDTLKSSEVAATLKASGKAERNETLVRCETPNRSEKLEKSDNISETTLIEREEKQEETGKIGKAEIILEDSEKVENIPYTETIKHPLENSWCMWLITNDKRNWEDNLIKLTTFDTIEDYWCLYHHMKPPSQLERGKDYAVFKNGFRPMWEDRANRAGGRWLVNFERKHNEASDLDSIWMFVVLLLIGESFKVPEAICGAVVSIRAKNRVAVWVADHNNGHAVLEVGKTIRDTLGLRGRLSFQQHNTSVTMHSL